MVSVHYNDARHQQLIRGTTGTVPPPRYQSGSQHLDRPHRSRTRSFCRNPYFTWRTVRTGASDSEHAFSDHHRRHSRATNRCDISYKYKTLRGKLNLPSAVTSGHASPHVPTELPAGMAGMIHSENAHALVDAGHFVIPSNPTEIFMQFRQAVAHA